MNVVNSYIVSIRKLSRVTSHALVFGLGCRGGSFVDARQQPWGLAQHRDYWNKRAPRTPPTKPLSFDYSGDLSASIGEVDLSQPKFGFEKLPEYVNADEVVKKVVSLDFSTKREVLDKVIHDLVDKVKDHSMDVKSTEIHIARETVLIRSQIQHCLKFRNDKVSKVSLIERIHHRNKTLKQLRRRDIEKFNWLTSELQLKLMAEPIPKKSKRQLREEAAREASAAVIARKNEEFRKRLAVEKVAFDKYRDAEIADIERSLSELGLDCKTSFDETLIALDASDLLPPAVRKVSRRRRKLEMLFQIKGEEKKKKDAEILRAHGFIVPKTLLASSSASK